MTLAFLGGLLYWSMDSRRNVGPGKKYVTEMQMRRIRDDFSRLASFDPKIFVSLGEGEPGKKVNVFYKEFFRSPIFSEEKKYINSTYLIDAWGREIMWRIEASTDGPRLILWSLGSNGLDENGIGDDVSVKCYLPRIEGDGDIRN